MESRIEEIKRIITENKPQQPAAKEKQMTLKDKGILYHALDVYAYIIANERNADDCQLFVDMLKRLSEDLEYDFTDV